MRIKDSITEVLFTAAVVAIAIVVVGRGCNSDRAELLEEEVGVLLNKNTKQEQIINSQAEIIASSTEHITELETRNSELEAKNQGLEVRIGNIQANYDSIASQVGNIPPDSIYAILSDRIYPDEDDFKPYPFSEGQIERIYVTKVKHDTLEALVVALTDRNTVISTQNAVKDTIISEKNTMIAAQDTIISSQDTIIMNHKVMAGLLIGEIKRQRLWKNVWKGTTATLTGIIIIKAFLSR